MKGNFFLTADVDTLIAYADRRCASDVIGTVVARISLRTSSDEDRPITIYPVVVVTKRLGYEPYEVPCPHHIPCGGPCGPSGIYRASRDVPRVPDKVVRDATLTIYPNRAILLTDDQGRVLERYETID